MEDNKLILHELKELKINLDKRLTNIEQQYIVFHKEIISNRKDIDNIQIQFKEHKEETKDYGQKQSKRIDEVYNLFNKLSKKFDDMVIKISVNNKISIGAMGTIFTAIFVAIVKFLMK